MNRTVSLDRDGLLIDGVRWFLLAGSIHYFRYPRAEWPALLAQAAWAGLNTIDTVIPWNRHEPRPGEFDFAEEADLAAFLDLCAAQGFFAIVRPGPYICAEWENGGIPAWLSAQPGVQLRVDDPTYLAAIGRWFDLLMAILAPRQITRGGPIILCQVENEHWASGRYGHDAHQQTLYRAACARGIEVPHYTCMGAMPGQAEFRNGWSGIAEKLLQTRALWPDLPLIVSELWSGWFDSWGASRQTRKAAEKFDVTLHQLTAVGASGFSHWMWAGGSNFGFWGGRTVGGDSVHMTTSYDYDAPVDEYGRLRAKAFVARRHHLFLHCFGARMAALLADAPPGGPCAIGPAAVKGRSEGGGMVYRNVQAPAHAPLAWRDFSATFLWNPSAEGVTFQLFLSKPVRHLAVEVEPMSMRPIFTNLPLDEAGELVLRCHTGRILGCWWQGADATLVIYGRPGEVGELELAASAGTWQAADGWPMACTQVAVQEGSVAIRYWITDAPAHLLLKLGTRSLALLLLDDEAAARYVPSGSALPGPAAQFHQRSDDQCAAGRAALDMQPSSTIGVPTPELPPAQASQGHDETWHGGPHASAPKPLAASAPSSPATTSMLTASEQVSGVAGGEHNPFSSPEQRFYLTTQRLALVELTSSEDWRALAAPQALEQLDCPYGYGWYRAEFELDTPLETTILAPALSDRATLLLDGNVLGVLGVDPLGPRFALPLRLAAGRHELRLLVDNLGRFNYGSGLGELKGLCDTLYLGGQQHDITQGWAALWQEALFAGEALANAHPAFVRPDAAQVDLSHFAFEGPSVWLLRTITARPGQRYSIYLTGDRNPGALFVNGVAVERFSRHRSGGLIKHDISAQLRPGENLLALNIQGYAGVPWRAYLLEYDPARPLPARWSFRAGVTPKRADAGDVNAVSSAQFTPPAFYRATFARAVLGAEIASNSALRVRIEGPRKGQLWLNERNVGRFWNIGSQEYLKIPVSWLRDENELLVFAEDGRACRLLLK